MEYLKQPHQYAKISFVAAKIGSRFVP
ncbi:hypothetical protein JOE45_003433 [Paenibacillus sp. PvR098]|nr:hypothetical protein [Paenibacillus sp. PvP091]MBP1171532.1 hypothetical protein [Paenibacillus sp. PvR098]MBP2437913.1 hypothetical protein [Paenibacillus sp. PvP052]